jgi:pimeloyl-ACP methyl ester carboxylesterase
VRNFEYERRPILIVGRDSSVIKETYAGRADTVVLEAHHLLPRGVASNTVLVFMHPIGGTQYLPMIGALAKSGLHVLSCNSRYPRNDSALIMEKVVLDLGACLRHAREKLGYEKVVLAGWSGGGSLSLFYQAQAERPSVASTPAGEPPSLLEAGLPRADAVALLAAHKSRAKTLTEWLDPSITDESRPFDRARELNLYDPACPHRPPFDAAFLAHYRAGQLARNRRITAWAQSRLEDFKRRGEHWMEQCFVVNGTMADPAWLDPAIEPSDRRPNWCFMGEPRMVNDAPAGLARYTTLRSWLSQYSYDLSNADGVRSAAAISVPVCVIENSADDGVLPHHARELYEAVPHGEKERHVIKGATHYYFDQPDKVAEAVGIFHGWMGRRRFPTP